MQTESARERLRVLGQADLGAHIEISTGRKLWSVQRRIARAVSVPRSKVVVPSCNASGKTHLAARLALAFYDSFKPGTPCNICGGPCGGAKIITTSSKWDHLSDNLWGELRMAYPEMVGRVGFEGRLLPGDLRLEGAPNWYIIGMVAEKEEGFQGYHAAHKLILGDEATSISEAVEHGITGLLASGDSRLCLILNPTTDGTYASRMSKSAGVETIRIRAWDTPHFTTEEVPEGSNLITPQFLEELKLEGNGPGTYAWETRIEAKFWGSAEDSLIHQDWVDGAHAVDGHEGVRVLGIDLATYGTNENVITYRDGNEIVWQRYSKAMRQDIYWETVVSKAVKDVQPHYVIYDADGPGSGVTGYADMIARQMTRWGGQVMPFRGGLGTEARYRNNRSQWWWNLRVLIENGRLRLRFHDRLLEEQLTQLKYGVTDRGDIRVETKLEMAKRGVGSPDRADSLMYACALIDDLPKTKADVVRNAEMVFGVKDHSDRAMWRRTMRQLDEADGDRARALGGDGPVYDLEPYPLIDWD